MRHKIANLPLQIANCKLKNCLPFTQGVAPGWANGCPFGAIVSFLFLFLAGCGILTDELFGSRQTRRNPTRDQPCRARPRQAYRRNPTGKSPLVG